MKQMFSLMVSYQMWQFQEGFKIFNEATILVQCNMDVYIVFTK